MALDNVASGDAVLAADTQQIIDLINGVSGTGQPVALTELTDSTNFNLDLRNRDTTNGRVARATSPTGVNTWTLDKNGMLVSPDGTAAATAVTVSHTQTMTAKTLTAPTIAASTLTGVHKVTANAGRVQLAVASLAIANAGTIAITDLGNAFTISGTSGTCTTITATGLAGQEITLTFSGTGATFQHGSGNLRLDGNFVSIAGAMLRLWCDGTNWYELGRAGDAPLGLRLVRTTNLALLAATDTDATWSSATWNYGAMWTAGASITIPTGGTGKYLITGSCNFGLNNGWHSGWLDVDGALAQQVFDERAGNNSRDPTYSFATTLALTAAGVLKLRVNAENAVNLVGNAGGTLTSLTMRRMSF